MSLSINMKVDLKTQGISLPTAGEGLLSMRGGCSSGDRSPEQRPWDHALTGGGNLSKAFPPGR